ncbi:hypothetical protein N658DRAFT_208526 [Parathielavia hyrcaniae]|uniref:Secreted protein n=1 Tax=Parathielavia hyrcaniae TaxID=113614 RepID=A0AAN6Q0I8_9PEZI|nr:hypothetical protein N658DRAFT_208526 [Parathielavia hyrcaniae]
MAVSVWWLLCLRTLSFPPFKALPLPLTWRSRPVLHHRFVMLRRLLRNTTGLLNRLACRASRKAKAHRLPAFG